jgi:hypothetical protein
MKTKQSRFLKKKLLLLFKNVIFFIDSEHPFLGASPDYVIGNDAIIEVKCVPSIENKSLLDAVRDKKSFCLEEFDSKLRLKKKNILFIGKFKGD